MDSTRHAIACRISWTCRVRAVLLVTQTAISRLWLGSFLAWAQSPPGLWPCTSPSATPGKPMQQDSRHMPQSTRRCCSMPPASNSAACNSPPSCKSPMHPPLYVATTSMPVTSLEKSSVLWGRHVRCCSTEPHCETRMVSRSVGCRAPVPPGSSILRWQPSRVS